MTFIPLRARDGSVRAWARVDVEDDWLNQWRWCLSGNGCVMRRDEHRNFVYLHRVLTDAQPGQVVDHRNGNKLDNRRDNLRVGTQAENVRNRVRLNRNNTSGYRGVWREASGRWSAKVKLDRRVHYLGRFDSAEAAHAAASAFRREHMPTSETDR